MNEDSMDMLFGWYDTFELIDTIFRPQGIFKNLGQKDETPLRKVLQNDLVDMVAYLIDSGKNLEAEDLDMFEKCLDDEYTTETIDAAVKEKKWLDADGKLLVPEIVRLIVGLDNEMHYRENATVEPQGAKVAGIFEILGGSLVEDGYENNTEDPFYKYVMNNKKYLLNNLYIFKEMQQ